MTSTRHTNARCYTPDDFKNVGAISIQGIAAVETVLESGKLFRYSDPNPKDSPAYQLEQWFVHLTGRRYALAANSCTSTIELALKAFGQTGDRVLIPAFTFGAVPSSVINSGMVPVLVECDRNLKIDLDDLREKAAGCQILLLSYMRGRIPDMNAIMQITREYGLTLIEDCAHGMGQSWDGKSVGTFGQAACYSFQDYKIIPAGDGGVVTTNDLRAYANMVYRHGAYEDLWRKHLPEATPEQVRVFEDLANKIPFHNYRISNLTAAVILPQLPLLYQKSKDYRDNFTHLKKMLSVSDLIEIPDDDPREDRALDSIQFRLRGFTSAETEKFVALVKKRGIPIAGLGEPGNARAAWNWLYLDAGELPQTREYLSNACDLRLVITLTSDMIEYLAVAFIESADQVQRGAA